MNIKTLNRLADVISDVSGIQKRLSGIQRGMYGSHYLMKSTHFIKVYHTDISDKRSEKGGEEKP